MGSLKMGKTVRYDNKDQCKVQKFRKPRSNRTPKGWDDLNFPPHEEIWYRKQPEVESYDPDSKRNKNKWKGESKRVKHKAEEIWKEFDDDEEFY